VDVWSEGGGVRRIPQQKIGENENMKRAKGLSALF
jgi:hypothetical protein